MYMATDRIRGLAFIQRIKILENDEIPRHNSRYNFTESMTGNSSNLFSHTAGLTHNYKAICNPVSQKNSLSVCVTLWPIASRSFKVFSLKFSQATLLCWWSLVCKIHWPSKQKESYELLKSGKWKVHKSLFVRTGHLLKSCHSIYMIYKN